MLEKIETMEIMTRRNAMLKYRTQHFIMVITEVVDQGDNDLGYIIYVADKEREFHKIPQSEGSKREFVVHGNIENSG